jgi:anti-sigma regulatory factor (Ser/Thr protein kinase)/biotin operon repressor
VEFGECSLNISIVSLSYHILVDNHPSKVDNVIVKSCQLRQFMERKKSRIIRQFIIEHVNTSGQNIVRLTSITFNISRQAVNRHIKNLIDSGLLIAEGSTRQRKYKLKPLIDKEICLYVSSNLQEDVVWRDQIKPLLTGIPKNVLDICHYGITEIVNNVIDHSSAKWTIIRIIQTAFDINMAIYDDGMGIFQKIKKAFGLETPAYAILELAKGKLTTDPEHHTGEGIFFSSRMFDKFSIYSGELFFSHNEIGQDWLLGIEDDDLVREGGTLVKMEISVDSNRTSKDVFDKYSADNDEYGFSKTIVPVVLAKYGDDNLISRSQAKRLLARLERFKEVLLDFERVESIGNAFADEIFRVFKLKNPHIHLMTINTNEEINKSIARANQNGKTQSFE